jgi:ribokinase
MIGGMTLDWIINVDGEVGVKSCGGNTMYAAAGARFWSDDIATVSRVGEDFPEHYLTPFAEAGIDVSHIRRVPSRHELVVAWRYDAQGNREDIDPPRDLPPLGYTGPDVAEEHLVYQHGMNIAEARNLDPDWSDVPAAYYDALGFHVASMHYDRQLSVANGLRERNLLFTIDPGWGDRPDGERRALVQAAPLLLPSEKQAVWLTGESTTMDAALERLTSFGAAAVAIKLGPLGSLVYDVRKRRRYHVPVYPARVKDPTGAGDAYCGGFIAAYAETGDTYESALRATVSSSFVIEGFDSRFTLRIDRREADERLRVLRELASS